MTPDVIKELQREQPSEFHDALLRHVMELVKMSRAKMAEHYTDWDKQDQVYRGERCLDKDDQEQIKRGKPTKMIVPLTFAQVMTFVSYLFLMYNQSRNFFETEPQGDEDYGSKQRDLEKILSHDLRRNQMSGVLFQHLLDIGRFGPGIIECCWTRKVSRIYVTPEPQVKSIMGMETMIRPESEWQEFVKYEGNLIRSVSPYKFFPDTRYPLSEFQRGEFCASEEEYSMAQLRELESVGEVAGVDRIGPLPRNLEKARGAVTRTTTDIKSGKFTDFVAGPGQSEGINIVTKVQVWLVPSQFKFGGEDKALGPETFPILYHIWYANDNRIIRAEPAYWWHNEFGWTVAQFTPDMHRTINMGLADLIYRLQDVVSWLINSHITDVRRNVRGRFIIDPMKIDTKSLDGETDIYIRSGMSGMPLDRMISQLQVANVTQSHMADSDILSKLVQTVTGVNDNAMGQYNTGRRAAREVATVTAGAAGRMKMHGELIWESSLGRLGQLMASNSRQSIGFDQFVRIIGQAADIEQRYTMYKGTPAEVVGQSDYFMFNSTSAPERSFIAQALQELLVAITSNPQAAMMLDIDPRTLFQEIQFLRGVGNVSRFSLSRNVANGAMPLPQPIPNESPTA